jgi:transcriptional antiterminator NusG
MVTDNVPVTHDPSPEPSASEPQRVEAAAPEEHTPEAEPLQPQAAAESAAPADPESELEPASVEESAAEPPADEAESPSGGAEDEAPAELETAETSPSEEEEAVEPEAAGQEDAPAEAPSNKNWYIVKVQSGREETIRNAVERKVKIDGLEEYFGQIYIPTEKVTELRNGKRYTRKRKVLPGYIMAEVEFNDRILYLFRETSGVGDFVGGTNNKPPPPMPAHEVKKWLSLPGQPGHEEETQVVKHDFEKGSQVRIKDGVFATMEGEVKEIIEAKNQVRVEVTIFGRPVAVELEYWQVEKL